MIVSFSVSNFRSFSSEETFSLVASNRLSGKHECHAVPIPGAKEKVLKTAVLYGANGAGKSNLFKALQYLKSVALSSRKKNRGTGREAFQFEPNPNKPSGFDLQFVTEDKLYRFGFKVDDKRIIEEWLVQVIGGKEIPLYERITDESGKVTIEAAGLAGAGEKLQALTTVGGPQNQSFLATIRATLNTSDYGDELQGVFTWFQRELTLLAPNEPVAPIGHMSVTDPDFLRFAGEFLKSSSTGVDHIEFLKKEIIEDDLHNLLPREVVSKVLENLGQNESGTVLVSIGDGNEILLERTDERHYFRVTIQAAHECQNGKIETLDLADESDGTRRLLNLVPALYDLRKSSSIYVIDEIDRSMHPMLVWKFLEFFLDSCQEGQGQLIVTTHESNLLDLDLLRRDEIWFMEKDPSGASHLYSMAEFKVRNDLEIRKHYLQGRFGAVPFLGNLDRLQVEQTKKE